MSSRLKELKKSAEETAVWFNHSLGPWSRGRWAGGDPMRTVSSAECTDCGAGVHVDTKPPVNGVECNGEAVSTTCEYRSPWGG